MNRNAAIEIGVFTYVLYLYCTWVPVYNKQELMCAVKVGFGDILSPGICLQVDIPARRILSS